MFKNEEDEFLFFKICKNISHITIFKERGYGYLEMIELLEWEIQKNNIIIYHDDIRLTELGEKRYLNLKNKSKMKKTLWIGKMTEVMIPKMEITEVYIK